MLIYDGDCGFCTRAAEWVRGQLRTPVLVVPWQEVHDLGDLELVTGDVSTAVYWVDGYGRRYRGARGVAKMLRLCRLPLPVAGLVMSVPPFDLLAAGLYWVIARNRYRLPGATAGCKLPRPVAFVPAGASTGPPPA